MMSKGENANLYLVPKPAKDSKVSGAPLHQYTLFPTKDLLIFVSLARFKTEQEFVQLLEVCQPNTIVELRTAPLFNLGRFDRKKAFELFERLGARYYDLASTPANQGSDDSLSLLEHFLTTMPDIRSGRIVVFLNEGNDWQEKTSEIRDTFARVSGRRWDVYDPPIEIHGRRAK